MAWISMPRRLTSTWPDVGFFKLNPGPADVDRVPVARVVAGLSWLGGLASSWPDVGFFKLNPGPADVDRVPVAREVAEDRGPFRGCRDGRRAAPGGSGAGTRGGGVAGTRGAT